MWDSRDRRDLAFLGLWVLVYGLAVAPVLHAVVGHGGGLGPHEHGASTHVHRTAGKACDTAKAKCSPESEHERGHGHQHLTGSVEHLLAVAASWTVSVPPRLHWVSWRVAPEQGPEWSPGQRLRSAAMPQGP